MFSWIYRKDVVTRIILIIMVLVNAVVPTTALANPSNMGDESVTTELIPPSSTPPMQSKVYYAPDEESSTSLHFSPDYKEEVPPAPEKDVVDFSVFAANGELATDRVLSLNVKFRNTAEFAVTDLSYSDNLQDLGDYISSREKQVEYNHTTKTVSLSINILQPGEEFSFSYDVKVKGANPNTVTIHNADIEYTYVGTTRSASTSLGFTESSTLVGADTQILVPDQAGDGWNSSGRISLYLNKEVLPQDAVVVIRPEKRSGKGPELQFNLDLLQTVPKKKDGNGRLNEQKAELIEVIEPQFETPAYLEINLDGVIDLRTLPADQEPYVATYDEEHNVWVKVPIIMENVKTNSVTVEAAHFSTWGAGLGNALPKNGANVLLFDQPYTSLFTGAARYYIPIWTPQGRAGMQPNVSLSYSSATVDGVLGDVQAPWTGVGWNIDGIEIVRKITTNENGYGYANDFALTLNGTVYKLVQDNLQPNRYYTDHDAFLYIERHNYAYGNAQNHDGAYPQNSTGEWWEVVTTDGTRYRMGWNTDSEQLALMYGYKCTTNGSNCLTPDGAYASLGYAGRANDLVALRWRVDRIQDTHGNYITYTYTELHPAGGGTVAEFDRESYLETIAYTGYENSDFPDKTKSPSYFVHFVYASRPGDVPTTYFLWDNVDSKLLDRIEVCYTACSGPNIVRAYDFGYSVATVPNADGTLILDSMEVTGTNGVTTTQAPTVRFTYENKANRAVSGSNDVYTYPRLSKIDNGAGGVLTYTYETDGRDANSWYNYRVKQVKVENGLGTAALQSYAYTDPIYSGSGGNPNYGELIGYKTTTESQLDYTNGDAVILSTAHFFGTSGLDMGRELRTELSKGATIYRRTTNIYVTDNSKAPFDKWNFRYLYSSLNYELSGGSMILATKSVYKRDPATGNLLSLVQYLGSATYRKTYYEYLTNPDPATYILDTASRVLVTDAANTILSDTRYHYDDQVNAAPTQGDLTLVQRLTGDGSQTVDQRTHYNEYGNVDSTKLYSAYGTADVDPLGTAFESGIVYDSALETLPIRSINPLGQETVTDFIEALGLPYRVTDPNGWETITEYDGLGRTLSVWAPGLTQPGVYYSYPQVNPATGRIEAPYSVEMQILDMAAASIQYRSVWGIYDGLGRMLQTQVYNADTQKLLVTDSYFNAQGLNYQQSLPYEITANGGYYAPPSGTQQFTTTIFDPLGRPLTVTQPGNIVTTTSYDGFATTILDPNNHKIVRTTDGLGRLVTVQEYTNAGSLYATTAYTYNTADRLIKVVNANGNNSLLQYDWLGRKVWMNDPDMGAWEYHYYPSGNLQMQKDARGVEIAFNYDALGRLTSKTGTDLNVTYQYGTTPGMIGLRIRMTDGTGTTTWNYSNFGRVVTENRQINGNTSSMTTTTDWLGRPTFVSYPDGETLSYKYDALGRPDQLTSDQNANLIDLAYNTLGQITSQTLGNGVVVTNTYNANTNRLESRASPQILNFSYTYDNAGNITQIMDGILDETHDYSYDFLNRLTLAEAYTAGSPTNYKYRQQFTYDPVGNMIRMEDWVAGSQANNKLQDSVDALVSYKNPESSGSYGAIPVIQATTTNTPSPDIIFEDGFESGDFSAWNESNTDGGDLSVSTQAAAFGAYGVQARIDGTTTVDLTNYLPTAEKHFSGRFYLNPNSVSIPDGQSVQLFDAVQWHFCLYLGKSDDAYTLTACGLDDTNTWFAGSEIPIQNRWLAVELEWKAASVEGANDGFVKLYVDDVLVSHINNLDNDAQTIDDVNLGVSDIPPGVSGSIYFDAYKSSKGQHIGVEGFSIGSTNTPMPTSTPTLISAVTVNMPIASGNNDVEENATGWMYFDSSDLELVMDGNIQQIGLRFTGVNIPQDVTILNAYIQFTVDETDSEATSLTIQAEAADNSVNFSESGKVSIRPRTSASVVWEPVAWVTLNQSGENQRTPDLSAVIQEVVDRQGWMPGNAISILITGTGKRVAVAYEGNASQAPYLVVEYATKPVSTPTVTPSETPTPTETPNNTATTTASPALPTFTSTPTQTSTNTAVPVPTLIPTPSTYMSILQPNASAGVDNYILLSSTGSNYGTSGDLGIGEKNNATGSTARSLIKFDLSSIPSNATILSATLSLWTSEDLSDNDSTVSVYRLKVPFNESQSNWNRRSSGNNWQVAGASGSNDRESTAIGSFQMLADEPIGIEKQVMLDPAKIQELTSGSFANNGFILVASGELNDRFMFKSSDVSTASRRPKLVIEYSISGGAPATNTATPMGTGTPIYTPTSTATSTHTNSPTPTESFTPSLSDTPTFTATSTDTPSSAYTPTRTPTKTPVPTNTHMATGTPSHTPTPTLAPMYFDSYTKSMLHIDGADGSTQFTDATGRLWTASGDAQTDTAQSKFGETSALFDGSGDYISTADSDDFAFGNGDFTIDFWVRFQTLPTSSYILYVQKDPNNNGNKQMLEFYKYEGAYGIIFQSFKNGGNEFLIGPVFETTWSAGTWYHIAIVRNGSNWYIFKNGVIYSTATTPANYSGSLSNISSPLYIGADPTCCSLNGWLDEFRVSKGTARWTSNFTPPASPYQQNSTATPTIVPTVTPYVIPSATPVPDQSLRAYWSFDSVTGTTVPDEAESDLNNDSATLVNGPVVQTGGASGNAVFFDGSNDYASVPHSAEISYTGSFTISAWVNPSSTVTSRTQYIVKKGGANQDYGLITVSRQGTPTPTANPANFSNGSIAFEIAGLSPSQLTGPILPNNTWTMVTGVYDATTKQMRLYINGDLVASQNVTGSITTNSNPLTFSSSNVSSVYHGSLDEVRLYDRALTGNEVQAVYGLFALPTPIPSSTPTYTPTSGFTATPMPIQQQQWGTGNDGSLTVSAGSTFNLNTQTNGNNGRTCADAVAYNITLLANTSATLDAAPASGCLNPGDEILLIQLTDSSPTSYNAGSYEFLRVESVNGNSVNFALPKKYWYGNGWRSDANIGVSSGQYRVMLMRVPNYSNVTVNGTLTANAFNGSKYGVVIFRVSNLLNGSGLISANALGFGGSSGYGAGQNGVYNGESASGSGGGGGYGTGGTTPWMGGAGGGTYGDLTLQRLFLGSGGGSAREHGCGDGECDPGSAGGRGGGILMVIGQTIGYSGSLTSNGGDSLPSSVNYSGAGSGGSIRIEGSTITLNTVTASGGAIMTGGVGRIAVYYQNSLTKTIISPDAYTALLGQAATPTPMPTPINLTTAPNWGTGADGDLVVNNYFNISSQNSGARSCPDGGDAVAYSVTSLESSSAKLTTAPNINCLKAGDEIVLIHSSGGGPNMGNYEFLRVGGVIGDSVYFTSSKERWYGSGAEDDTNISNGQNRVMLMRVPNYRNVTINGTLTTETYNGYKNGLIVFRVSNTLSGSGVISANKLGFPASSGYGGGGNGENTDSGYGGGASYATSGTGWGGYGTWGGVAGALYGEASLQKIYYGSGGGNSREGGENNPGSPGGAGGGMIIISGRTINFSGSIQSNGADSIAAPRGRLSGAGSGGSIRMEGETVILNTVSASGGSGVNGGYGRIAVYYYTSFSGNFIPGYLEQWDQNGTLTPVATFTPTLTPTITPTSTGSYLMNLSSWWSMDEISSIRYDMHGSNDLTDNNTVGYAAGLKGNAANLLYVDNESLSHEDNPGLSATGPFTFGIWLYTNGSKAGRPVNKGDYVIYQNYSGIHCSINNESIVSGAGSGTIGASSAWYFVVCVYDGSSLKIYVNGTSYPAANGTALDTSNPLLIQPAGVDGINVDETFYYKRALSANEIAWLYNSGNGRSYSEIIVPPTNTPTPTPGPENGWTIREFAYDASHPHAVASVSENSTPAASYVYDANGNMTCRVESGVTYLHAYNTENRISSITKLTSGDCVTPGNSAIKWDFGYDGDGVRLATLTTTYDESGAPSGSSWTAYYFGGAYEVRNDNTMIKYYSFAGQMVAMNECTPQGCGTGLQYFLTDHLGSVVAVTDASGTLIAQQRYLPFGAERSNVPSPNSPSTDYGYTGQRNLDPGMGGLMDYKARFYSPYLNRFIQPDTIIPDPFNPQSWNRYVYVNNRPLNFNDPTGHVWEPPSRPIEIADISSWPLWAQVTTSVVVGFFGLVVDNGKIRTMNAAEGVDALATTPMTVSFPKIPTTGTSKANLINAAKELIKYGPESTEGKAAIKLLAETSTVNPNAKSVVIGSYPEYANYGARKGHTYFSMDPEVWKILDTPGKPWMPINEQFVLNQQNKRFYVSFKGATFGDGLTLELKTLKELAKKPIFLKME